MCCLTSNQPRREPLIFLEGTLSRLSNLFNMSNNEVALETSQQLSEKSW